MRVVGGNLKSRRLKFPKTRRVRPAMDRVKESLFNILGETVINAKVLDLYAGCGSVGIEAISRGAESAIFVDNDPLAVKYVKINLEELNIGSQGEVVGKDVLEAITWLGKSKHNFDLIFIDPPYNKGLVKKTLLKLDRSDILSPFATIVVEHSRQEVVPEALANIKLGRSKRFGATCLSFLYGR